MKQAKIRAIRSTRSSRGSALRHWPLASHRYLSGKHSRISFFCLADFGKLVRAHSAHLGYLRTSETHLGHHKIPRNEERIKRRRDHVSEFQISTQFSTTFCQFYSSTLPLCQFKYLWCILLQLCQARIIYWLRINLKSLEMIDWFQL